jgi:predicted MFS family arabinose efflux permease
MIYAIRFFSYCSWGVLYPFFGVWLLKINTLSPDGIGVVIALAVISNRVGSILIAPIITNIDKRSVIVASQLFVILASIAFYMLATFRIDSFIAWSAVAVLFGLANSIATLAQITYIAIRFAPKDHVRAFSYENVALNIAAGVAPFISSLIVANIPEYMALSPIAFAITGVIMACFIPSAQGKNHKEESGAKVRQAGSSVILAFLMMNFLTMIAYAQFYGVFPIYGVKFIEEEVIGLIFAFSSFLIITLQLPLTKYTEEKNNLFVLCLANIFTAFGTVLLIYTGLGISYVLLAVLFIVIGEVVYAPMYQAIALYVVNKSATTALAVLTFVWGVAESIAIYIGVILVQNDQGVYSFLAGFSACLIVAFGLISIIVYRRISKASRP